MSKELLLTINGIATPSDTEVCFEPVEQNGYLAEKSSESSTVSADDANENRFGVSTAAYNAHQRR